MKKGALTMSKKNEKILTPSQERRKQFVNSFFATVPVRIGFVILVVIAFAAIFAPLVAPYDYNKQDLLNTLQAPGGNHILGTDALGRDLLSRIIYGARASLSVGIVSTVIAGGIGITLGLIAGYLGKAADIIIMRIMDAMMSIPVVILALFLGSILGKGLGNIMLCIGIVMMPGYARMTRGQVLSVKQLDYVTAGKIGGATRIKNAVKHILPNCLAPNLVLATMNLGSAIMVEAGLSFLGMGINPPTPSWGAMVSEGYKYLAKAPHIAIIPGIFIILTVWSFNVCGDALRDATDPRLRGTK